MRRWLAGLGSLSVCAVAVFWPLEADASVATFAGNLVWDIGESEAVAAAGPDEATAGLAALVAAAVGTAAAVTGSKLGSAFFNSRAPSDIWSFAQANASNVSSWMGSAWNAAAGGAVAVSQSFLDAVNSWWGGSSGVGASLGYGVVGPQSAAALGSGDVGAGDVSAGYSALQPLCVAVGGCGYWYDVNNTGNGDREVIAATAPLQYSGGSQFNVGDGGAPGTIFVDETGTYGQSGVLQSGAAEASYTQWAVTAELFANGAGSAPAVPWSSGQSVTLPPVAQTPSGDIGIPTPTVLPNGDVGLTADGTTAIDTASGQSVAVDASAAAAESATAANTGALAQAVSTSGAIDWSPLEDVGSQLETVFPFSIPWDIKDSIVGLQGTAQAPSWSVSLPMGSWGTTPVTIAIPSYFDTTIMPIWRGGVVIAFGVGLALMTRRMLGGAV